MNVSTDAVSAEPRADKVEADPVPLAFPAPTINESRATGLFTPTLTSQQVDTVDDPLTALDDEHTILPAPVRLLRHEATTKVPTVRPRQFG